MKRWITHLAEEGVHEGIDNLDLLSDRPRLFTRRQDTIQNSALFAESPNGNLETIAFTDHIQTDRYTTSADLLDLLGSFSGIVIVDNFVDTVGFDEIERVWRAHADDSVSHKFGELRCEETDGRGCAVEQELK
jgi:hypothetical protein